MKIGLLLGATATAALVYLVASSAGLQSALGTAATTIVRPVVIPLIELINVPAFVYCAALLILLAGLGACGVYEVASLRPYLAELRRVRTGVGELPQPRLTGAMTLESWGDARLALGMLLLQNDIFVAGWSVFQAESLSGRGVPSRPFSSFVAAEPSDAAEPGGFMRSLPGYFTSIGLILTFIGLVVALYFAAKGFRTGDMGQARAAIVQLLNAASFKFLTSVAALISSLVVSLYGRYGAASVRRQRRDTLDRIEAFLAQWREKVGISRGSETLVPDDLFRRFDALLSSVADLARDVHLLAQHGAMVPPALAAEA